jgi:HK97 family phage major capsid protein
MAETATIETETEERSILEQLQERRSTLLKEMADAIEARKKERSEFEGRAAEAITDEDRSSYETAGAAYVAQRDQRKAEIAELDQRIDEEELLERRKNDAQKASIADVRVEITHEEKTYERGNGRSYYRDMAVTHLPGARAELGGESEALERLQKHAAEVRVELPKIEQRYEERHAMGEVDRAERSIRRELSGPLGIHARGIEGNPFTSSPVEKRVNPNRLDGQGGFFVPPLWLPEFIKALRAGRPTADLCRQMPLPQGTDSINMPKIKTPTEVAAQTADSAPVAERDWTDEAVTSNVKTLAGQSDVAIQLLEQSPYHLDEVITEDLIADLNRKVDREVIAAPGTNTAALNAGLIQGLYPAKNWNANTVNWEEAAPDAKAFNMAMGAGIAQIAASRFSVQNVHVVTHPRRWYWMSTQLDGLEGKAGRPIVNAEGFGPFNLSALVDGGEEPAEGLVGQLPYGPHGVYVDANIPTKDTAGVPGAGTADVAIIGKFDDAWLFEGALRTRALSEVLSGTLEIRFQAFEYYAFLVRYGQSLAIVSGTGFAPPVGTGIGTSIKYTSSVYAPEV